MKLLLDCGAHSAAGNPDIVIKLDRYIAYVRRNQSLLHQYISLDIIPQNTDPDHVEWAAQQSYNNHREMKAAGLSPLPVFHFGDHFRWLHRLLEDGEKTIALAHRFVHRSLSIPWFDQCFALLPKSINTHGLGLSTALMLRRFPFTSVDSSSWVKGAKNGCITVPFYPGKRPDFLLRPHKFSVTKKSSMRTDHIDGRDPFVRQQAEIFLREELGLTWEQVRLSKPARMRTNLKYYAGLAACTDTRLFFVTNTDNEQQQALTQSGAMTRLLSYAELQGRGDDVLEKYCAGFDCW